MYFNVWSVNLKENKWNLKIPRTSDIYLPMRLSDYRYAPDEFTYVNINKHSTNSKICHVYWIIKNENECRYDIITIVPSWSQVAWTLTECHPFLFTYTASSTDGACIRTCVPSTHPMTLGNPPRKKTFCLHSPVSAGFGHFINMSLCKTWVLVTLLMALLTVF